MEGKEFKIKKNKFKTVIKTLIELENIFTKYEQKVKQKEIVQDVGYLIDKKYFDDFKNKILYSSFKYYINDDSKFDAKLNELYGNNESITYIPLEQKIFNTSQEFVDKIFKEREYIIINLLVWKKLNNGKYKEDEGKINFEIKETKITVNFSQAEFAYFKFNSNLILYDNLISRSGNNITISDQINDHKKKTGDAPKKLIANKIDVTKNSEADLIDDLYLSMIEYNNYEKLLMKKFRLNSDINKEKMEGYFIEKNWFIKWKKYTDYDNNRFLLSDNINEQDINKIKESIKSNYKSDIKPIKIIKYFNKNNLTESVFKNDIYILVSENFIKIFEKKIEELKEYKITFKILHHIISFSEGSNQINNYYSFNNILPIESNESYKIANNLIELYIFQEQLKIKIKQRKNNEKKYNLVLK